MKVVANAARNTVGIIGDFNADMVLFRGGVGGEKCVFRVHEAESGKRGPYRETLCSRRLCTERTNRPAAGPAMDKMTYADKII